MIWESCYWKEPLLESAARLRDYSSRDDLEEAELVSVERDVFIGFYSIRKLMDTAKIKDTTKAWQVTLEWHPNVKRVDLWNSHRLDELYDFSQSHNEVRGLRFLCNQIIHSFVFIPYDSEDGFFGGIFFSSDKDKNKKLYALPVSSLIKVFELVRSDYPTTSRTIRDPETGELHTQVW